MIENINIMTTAHVVIHFEQNTPLGHHPCVRGLVLIYSIHDVAAVYWWGSTWDLNITQAVKWFNSTMKLILFVDRMTQGEKWGVKEAAALWQNY